jgi:hypothetical protein
MRRSYPLAWIGCRKLVKHFKFGVYRAKNQSRFFKWIQKAWNGVRRGLGVAVGVTDMRYTESEN